MNTTATRTTKPLTFSSLLGAALFCSKNNIPLERVKRESMHQYRILGKRVSVTN